MAQYLMGKYNSYISNFWTPLFDGCFPPSVGYDGQEDVHTFLINGYVCTDLPAQRSNSVTAVKYRACAGL